MNLSLTPELEQFIQHKVATGMYANASEVVRDALRHMDKGDDYALLREFIAPRLAAARSGAVTKQSFDSIMGEVKPQ